MTTCPSCKTAVTTPKKNWTYHVFEVRAYKCQNCGTEFRDYIKRGRISFSLRKTKAGKFIKA